MKQKTSEGKNEVIRIDKRNSFVFRKTAKQCFNSKLATTAVTFYYSRKITMNMRK